MVYETDFYTTRRPYTSSRPTITSYSVTRREVPWHKVPTVPRPSQVAPCFTVFGSRYLPDNGLKLPGLGKGQTFHRNIPHIAHKKLVVIGPSAHSLHHIKQSAYLAEIDRIYHKTRPSLAYQPTEDYLNSRSIVSFDDETRSIRAKTAEILKRIHTPIPRAQRPMPLPGELKLLGDLTTLRNEITILTLRLVIFPRSYDDGAYYSHTELPISERISSDNYIDRLLSANKEVQHNVLTMSHYDEPARHYNSIGKGHLACVSFAGGRPISKRRNLASADDYIRDDIKVLSHYGRFRAAAEGAPHVPDTEYAPLPHRPPTKSSVTGSWKSNAPHKTERAEATTPTTTDHEPHIKANLTAGDEFDKALDKKQRRREAIEAAALREAEEEKRRKQELSRQEELAAQAAQERQEELEKRAKQEEEAQRLKEEEEIIARENAERLAAEKRAQDEADKKAKEEEERKAKEEAERLAKEEEARKAKEAEQKAKEEAERKAKEEEERKAKEEADRLAKEEEERKAKEEAERLAKEEEERKAKEEAERLAKEEEERKAKEEAERLAKEEEERKAKEEAERLAKEEEERKAKEEAERLAKEEEERLAKEAAENAVEESGPEPVVEEPQSPEDAPVENTEAPTAEEVEDEEEEEEEE